MLFCEVVVYFHCCILLYEWATIYLLILLFDGYCFPSLTLMNSADTNTLLFNIYLVSNRVTEYIYC